MYSDLEEREFARAVQSSRDAEIAEKAAKVGLTPENFRTQRKAIVNAYRDGHLGDVELSKLLENRSDTLGSLENSNYMRRLRDNNWDHYLRKKMKSSDSISRDTAKRQYKLEHRRGKVYDFKTQYNTQRLKERVARGELEASRAAKNSSTTRSVGNALKNLLKKRAK